MRRQVDLRLASLLKEASGVTPVEPRDNPPSGASFTGKLVPPGLRSMITYIRRLVQEAADKTRGSYDDQLEAMIAISKANVLNRVFGSFLLRAIPEIEQAFAIGQGWKVYRMSPTSFHPASIDAVTQRVIRDFDRIKQEQGEDPIEWLN